MLPTSELLEAQRNVSGENRHSLRDILQVTAERTDHSSTAQGLGNGLAGK